LLCLPPDGGRASHCQVMPRDGDAPEEFQRKEEAAEGEGEGKRERWIGGEVERWRCGEVERWRCGVVERLA
jgi:hypothetical protein